MAVVIGNCSTTTTTTTGHWTATGCTAALDGMMEIYYRRFCGKWKGLDPPWAISLH